MVRNGFLSGQIPRHFWPELGQTCYLLQPLRTSVHEMLRMGTALSIDGPVCWQLQPLWRDYSPFNHQQKDASKGISQQQILHQDQIHERLLGLLWREWLCRRRAQDKKSQRILQQRQLRGKLPIHICVQYESCDRTRDLALGRALREKKIHRGQRHGGVLGRRRWRRSKNDKCWRHQAQWHACGWQGNDAWFAQGHYVPYE